MPPCLDECPREQMSQDEVSPGVIGDDELICRALYPSDTKAGIVKSSAIPASQLWAGQLSVWRVSHLSGLTVEGLAELLNPRMHRRDETFDEIRGTPARQISNFKVEGTPERAFSLLDECTMDNESNKHPAHAHIAICREQIQNLQRGDEIFIGLHEGLKLIFKAAQSIWRRAN
jgi:hypothetical protein